MAKRKLDRSCSDSPENLNIKHERFDIPPFLKTEQICVDERENIKLDEPPCTISNTPCLAPPTPSERTGAARQDIPRGSLDQSCIVLTCERCGVSGTHRLDARYRLVKTAMLVEAATQTDPVSPHKYKGRDKTEDCEVIGAGVGSLRHIKTESIDPFYYDSVITGMDGSEVLDHGMEPVKMECVDSSYKELVHNSPTPTSPVLHTYSTPASPVDHTSPTAIPPFNSSSLATLFDMDSDDGKWYPYSRTPIYRDARGKWLCPVI